MLQVEDQMRFIFLEYSHRYGKADGYFSFETNMPQGKSPSNIIIFYWVTKGPQSSTTFCTLGVSEHPMNNGERAEMHLTLKRKMNPDQIMDFCYFIANFAIYPFLHEFALTWWSLIIDVGQVPLYANSSALLIQPEFSDSELNDISIGEDSIRLYNIVPLTNNETQIAQHKGIPELLDYIVENEIDMLNIR